MKRLGSLIALAALLSGCAVQEVDLSLPAESPAGHAVHFTATTGETRTAFGTPTGMSFPTYWTSNDTKVLVSVNGEEAVEAAVTPSSDYKTAEFDASFGSYDSYTFYAISPASASGGMSPSRKAWKVTIPSEQTPLAESCDESSQIIVAKTAELSAAPSKLDLSFKHLTAYMSITLKNLPEGTEVSSVELTTGVPIVGEYYYDCESGELTDNGASSTVTLTTDASGAVWVACAPVDLSGVSMTITVKTVAGNYVKKVTFPEGRELTPGKIALFSVNFSGIEPEATATEETVYELVSSLDDLAADDKIVILSSDKNYAMTATSSSGLTAVAKDATAGFTLESDGYVRLPEGSSVAVLTVSSLSGSIQFKTGSNYLAVSGNGGNRTLGLSTTSTSWTLSVESGAATVSYKGTQRTYYISYASSKFNIGTSTGTVCLYRETTVGGTSTDEDPILDYEEYGAYLSSNTWVYAPASDHLSREYNDEDLTFAILSPFKNTIMEFVGIPKTISKGMQFTLTLNRQEDQVVAAHASYEVTVVKESGRKVWLSDGKKNGFIVKK